MGISETSSRSFLNDRNRTGDWRFLAVLVALLGSASIATDIYLPAIPSLAESLHARQGAAEFTISSFLLGFGVGQLLWGPIGDRMGRRWPVAIGIALFTAGSVGCALSTSIIQLTSWRVVQAIGACAGPVLARAMIYDIHGRTGSARMLSTLMLVMNIAPLIGPLIGGQILTVATWRAIFWTMAAFNVVVFASAFMLSETLEASRRSTGHLGDALRSYGQLLRNRRVMAYAIVGGLFYAGIFANVAGTPFAYIKVHHVPVESYGLLFGLNIIGLMAMNYLNSRITHRYGVDRLILIGTTTAAVAGVWMAFDASTGWLGLAGLVVPVVLYTGALGLIVANSIAGALAAFPSRSGSTSALVGAIHFGTGMLGSAAVGWFADGTARPLGFAVALAGVSSLAVACIIRFLPSTEGAPHSSGRTPRGQTARHGKSPRGHGALARYRSDSTTNSTPREG